MARNKNNKDPFTPLQKGAVGIAGLGIAIGVGAGIAARAPAGTPNLSAGFNVVAGFAPIAVTAVGGKAVLNVLPKSKGVKIKGRRVI